MTRLRAIGIGAVAVLGGSLLVVPAVSEAQETGLLARPAPAAADRIVTVARPGGRSAFEFRPASGDRDAPFAFVSTGGTVSARRLGVAAGAGSRPGPVVSASSGAPAKAAQAVTAAATTYKTTLTVDSQNWTAFHAMFGLWNRDTWTYVPVTSPDNSLSTAVNLPPGNYYATAMYGIYDVNSYLLTKAFTVGTKAQTIHLAESSAKEVAFKVDDATARRDGSAVWMSLPNGDLVGFGGGALARTYATTASVAGTTLRLHEVLTKAGTTGLRPSPYRYDLMKSWPHPLPASPIVTVKTASLAKTTTTVLGQGVNADATYSTVPMTGEWTGAYLPTTVRAPATFTEYVTPGVTMSRSVSYGSLSLQAPDRTLSAGVSPGGTIGAGPLAPGHRRYGDDSRRENNKLYILENTTLSDAAGDYGYDSSEAGSATLSSGGQVLAKSPGLSLSATVPDLRQTYQLDQTTTRKVAGSPLSSTIRSEWTFPSSGPSFTKLPLMDLAFATSGVDQRNRAGTAAPVTLTVTPSTRQVTAVNRIDRVEWSTDDGVTWADLPLTAAGDGAQVSMTVPAAAAFVSLRVTASNDQGGALRRTVMRALAGPATPGNETAGATTITNVKVNGGKALVVGTPDRSLPPEFQVTFTATDPSGIKSAGAYLWHGAYNTPDGVLPASTLCTEVNATTSNCTAYLYLWDPRYLLAGNGLAGAWQAEVWASAKDGTGFADRRGAASVAIKRETRLTADATPEPVAKNKTITVTGTLTRADWAAWAFKPYASQTVTLQWAKAGTYTWKAVKTVRTDANGKLKTTVKATLDGSYRWTYAGDAASNTVTSAGDYIDVR